MPDRPWLFRTYAGHSTAAARRALDHARPGEVVHRDQLFVLPAARG